MATSTSPGLKATAMAVATDPGQTVGLPKLDDNAARAARVAEILDSFEGTLEKIERDRTFPVDDIESFD